MGYDLRGELVSSLQKLGYGGQTLLNFVSGATLEEQRQLKLQKGPKKRTYFLDSVGDLGYSLALSTKRIGDEIVSQLMVLLGPNGESVLYQILNRKRHGVLRENGGAAIPINPEQAVDRMLLQAYGLSQQPH